jgi:hypothetical protein
MLSELSYIEICVVPISRKFERPRDKDRNSDLVRDLSERPFYKFISKIKDKKFTQE